MDNYRTTTVAVCLSFGTKIRSVLFIKILDKKERILLTHFQPYWTLLTQKCNEISISLGHRTESAHSEKISCIEPRHKQKRLSSKLCPWEWPFFLSMSSFCETIPNIINSRLLNTKIDKCRKLVFFL